MMETPENKTYGHNSSPKMDHTYGKRQSRSLALGGLMCLVVLLVVGIVIENPWRRVYESEGETGNIWDTPRPAHPESPVPEGQLSMASEDVPEGLVVQEQEGRLHARRNIDEEPMVEPDAAVEEEQRPPPFKLPIIPILPLPTDIIDLPIKIPTHISDILGDLPLPTLPKDPNDIIDVLPTEPGDIISGIPIPTVPPIPVPTLPIPTLPIPVLPVPTKAPTQPPGNRPPSTRTEDDNPFPLPTVVLPPSKPRDPGDGFGLPEIIAIPHKILGLLHQAVSQLSNDPNLPRPVRDMLRLIQRIIERVAGGPAVPRPPKKPKPTVSLPLPLPLPTGTEIPIPIPTLPTDLTTLLPPPPEATRSRRSPLLPPPRPTLTLPPRARRAAAARGAGAGGPEGRLSDGERRQLKGAVSDEIWSSVNWSNPILAPLTAAAALLAFDSVYRVAEAFKEAGDEGGREELLGLLVVVDDDEVGDEEAMT
ncbi:hypothetical protein KVR01_006006 [Diaporthe batatas]|uniref:uncharacterized protein n=1 Tax=Diaporthe batatas TaxID=748121 RepID=UPI001D054BA4|nr:uncharacterized protein KVR01_006006 [Diaporthe batatas]KAG8164088.1 hypothetical protein KVR01_006006 [Diaporthe batatas]